MLFCRKTYFTMRKYFNLREIIVIGLAMAGMFFAGRGCGRNANRDADGKMHTVTRTDTVVVRDTLRDTVLVPFGRYIVRTDTVWMQAARDTVPVEEATPDSVRIALPIEQKVYSTDDYRAVVEGFRPALVEMEIFRNTTFVTRETTHTPPPRRWGVGIQAGYGFGPRGGPAARLCAQKAR